MKFRAVLFDAAETLFTTRGSVGEIYAGIAHRFGSTAQPDAIQAAFTRHFRGSGPLSVQDQKQWWKDLVFRVFSEVGMVRNFDEFFEILYDNFRNSEGWVLFPETRDVLKELKQRGLKLGIISNFDTRIYSVLEDLRIRDFFDAITISSETGYSKPDPKIFESAAVALQVSPENIILVGDSPDDDVEAALKAGMSALLIDRHRRHVSKKHLLRISSLEEVLNQVTP